MEGADNKTTPDQATGSEDWDVVPKEGTASEPSGNTPAASEPPKPQAVPSSKQASAAATPAAGGLAAGLEGEQNDFSSLGDLDTAGSAIVDFGNTPGALGESMDLNMEMDESAFGDAFHGVDSTQGNTPGETNI